MKEEKGRITHLWLNMVHVSDIDRALWFYNEILGLPIALDARAFIMLKSVRASLQRRLVCLLLLINTSKAENRNSLRY